MRFLVADRQLLPEDVEAKVYMTGLDGVPWKSRTYWDGDDLLVERRMSDSGRVWVPYRPSRGGEITIPTSTLMQRDKPYLIEVELARGLINQIRNQIAAWKQVGMVMPATIATQLAEIGGHFAQAATAQHEPAAAVKHAVHAIDKALELDLILGEAYTNQAIAVRRRQTPTLPTLLAVNLGTSVPTTDANAALVGTFNAAMVPLDWRRIESVEGQRNFNVADAQMRWCQSSGVRICSGPLLQIDNAGIPDWAYLWEGDFDNLLAFMREHVRAVVSRYKGRVHLWQVASRANSGQALSLSEEQRLHLVVRAIEAIREVDPRTPQVVSFAQPWAEYLAQLDLDLAPMHFADTLMRAELGLAGVALEINMGYSPGGTLPRTMLDLSWQLDLWSQLGTPLMIELTYPSAAGALPQTLGPARPTDDERAPHFSLEGQSEWIERFVPLLIAKNCVQVVAWNQLRDSEPHEFPYGGLVQHTGEAKPALAALRDIRQEYLT